MIGDRIKERLDAVGMSQSELARRVSLTQSTIAGLIGGRSRSSSHLHKIARELATTPAFLAGETDDPEADAPDPPALNYEQIELVECYDRMSPANRAALLQMARALAEREPPRKRMHEKPVGFRAQHGRD